MLKVMGLWQGQSKKTGATYFSSNLTSDRLDKLIADLSTFRGQGCKVLMLGNNFKKADKEPDFHLQLASFDDGAGTNAPRACTVPANAQTDDTIDDSEIPF